MGLLFLILISLSFISALSYPHAFHGTAKYNNGTNIPNGYIISGEVNGVISGSTTISDGKYDLVAVDEVGNGGEVKFYINGAEADQTSTFIVFEVTELDLTIDSAPPTFVGCGDNSCKLDENCSSCPADCGSCPAFCGDETCDPDETCSSCSSDCGSCPVATSSGGGSSGGSGGGSSRGSSFKINSSSVENSSNNYSPLNSEEDEIKTVEELNENSEKNSKSGITGAVIGFAKTKLGIGLIFAGIIIVLGSIIILIRRRG